MTTTSTTTGIRDPEKPDAWEWRDELLSYTGRCVATYREQARASRTVRQVPSAAARERVS